MEIRAKRIGNIIILDLSGRIDVNSATFIEVVGQCLRDGYCDILCNFEMVDFIDYMGISVIIIAYKEIINNGGRMKFCNISGHLKGLLAVAGLGQVIDVYATEDLAIESFKEDKIIENIQKLQLRRRFKRLPIDIKIELKNKYEQCPECLKADILDLSAVGSYVYDCHGFKLGDEVILKFKLLPNQEELEITAKVVWLSDKQIQPHLHPGMGVEFYHISTAVQQKLLEFIERNMSFMSTDE